MLDRKLAIIVPYRGRPEHLARFVPHMAEYFQRDPNLSLHIVEQAGTGIFNRGKLKNVGYALARNASDYVCFHDIDYLPLAADYSWSPRPARLIWHGLTHGEDWHTFLAAVVLFDKPSFERINGFPNGYWGWGFEDAELGVRCDMAGIAWDKRDGTFESLPHAHQGIDPNGVPTKEALATQALFWQRRPGLKALMPQDGLSDLEFTSLPAAPLLLAGQPVPNFWHHIVDIGGPG